MSFITYIRKCVIGISPSLAAKGGAFYSKVILPNLPKRISTPSKMIGHYGPFKFDSRFMLRDFTNWGGEHNKGFEACVEASIGKKCVLDIGGHIGLVTMPLSRVVGPEGKVFTFEPADANRKYLQNNINLNKINNVEIFDCLVGAENNYNIPFFEQADDTGLNSRVVKKDHDKFVEVKKTQVCLDSFCKDKKIEPEVIKIDVEGAEFDVLTGAKEIIKEYKPLIFLSLHPEHLKLFKREPEELREIVNVLNYECVNIDGSQIDSFKLDECILRPINQN